MSVRKSLAWAFSGQFATFAVTFASSVVLARLLSPMEMGIYALAIATLGILQIVASFGVSAYIVREAELSPETVDSAFTVNGLLAIFLALVMIAASFGGTILFGDPRAGAVMRVLALGPLIGIFSFRPSTMLQREMQFQRLATIGVGAAIVNAAVTIGAAYLGFSYMSPAYGGVVAALVGAVATNLAARRHISLRVSLKGWQAMTAFGLRIMSISGVAVLLTRFQDLILGRMLGLAALGLYSRATNISNNIFDNLYGTATRVVFTKLAKDFRERGELRESFLTSLQMIIAVMWPILIGLAILARPAIFILYGEKWLAAALPLSLLMIAQFFVLCFGMNWELFVLRDETAKQTRLEIGRSLISLVLFIIGCRFGIGGAALGAVAGALFGLVVYFPHVNRLAHTRPGELFRIYWQSALLTIVAAGPSLALMMASHWSPHTPPLWIAAAVGLGIALWAGVILWLRHPLRAEAVILWRNFANPKMAPEGT